MHTVTPSLLFQRHLDTVLGQLPGVFDGSVENVHQARIATRRLREVLPLVKGAYGDGAAAAIRNAGRHLGRVRELDVMSATLDVLGQRVIGSAATAVLARRAVAERLRTERRAMVKALEKLDLEDLRGLVALDTSRWHLRRPDWIAPLWDRISTRAADAAEAVRRAPGIYLPNRSHGARIAIKKLRYAVEIASETAIWRPERLLKDLRRLQSALGDVHDAQVLADDLEELVPSHAGTPEMLALKATLEDDLARHHASYVSRRERMFAIADACAEAAGRARRGSRPARAVMAASVVAVPLLLAGRRRE